jgi:hypothetical protein
MTQSMSMSQADAILECARTIRPYLPDLLRSADAASLDRALAELLAKAQMGQKVEAQITDVLSSRQPTRKWMRQYLAGTISYPPGTINPPPPLKKCVCPHGDFVWYQGSVGQTPPPCPTHGPLTC